MRKPSLLALVLFFITSNSNIIHSQKPFSYPKLYLHTDREVYFIGDSIWFKAYYLNAQTQQFVPGNFSMYLDFINDQGQTIISQVLHLESGISTGKLEIPDSIAAGNYLIRAFTDFQRNIGEAVFFYKKIKVTSVEARMEEAIIKDAGQLPEIDVSFLPEGGFLLDGQVNTIGVKVVDDKGIGVFVKGEILNSREEIVASFDTEYKGMGSFQFSPLRGESYRARIIGKPEFGYSFDEIIQDGIKIDYSGESKDDLVFRISTNSEVFIGETYYFALLHRGNTLFHQKFIQKGLQFPLKVEKAALAPGINRLVLLDDQLKPISERLYFSSHLNVNDIKIVPDQLNYGTRSEVQIKLFDEKELTEKEFSNLSVAVIDSYALGVNGPKQNILSWLLIDSELKGTIESPAHFFKDDAYLSSMEKLNLLMLTHGWSRYIWTAFDENPPSEIEVTNGISIEGTVKHAFTKKPVAKGDVELMIYSEDGFSSVDGKTDNAGRYKFSNIVFTDTASIFIQGRNKRGSLYTVLDIDPLFKPNPALTQLYFPRKESKLAYSSRLYEQKYYGDLDLRNYVLDSGSIFLEEVSIIKDRNAREGYLRYYAKPFHSFEVTKDDYEYINVGFYLQSRVGGISIFGDQIMMRARRSSKLRPVVFLLNGFPADPGVVKSIPMSEIELVELIRERATISVFTKSGESYGTDHYVQGTISQRLKGYSTYKEFYSPRYTPENIDTGLPDHRITLYWNPFITTEKGEAAFSFFTSDDKARFKILVEGVSDNGTICLGISEFEVIDKSLSLKGRKTKNAEGAAGVASKSFVAGAMGSGGICPDGSVGGGRAGEASVLCPETGEGIGVGTGQTGQAGKWLPGRDH